MGKPEIIVFDVNETLLDLDSIRPVFDRIFREPDAMRLWFANLITFSEALTLAGVYVPFTDIGAAVLRMLASTMGKAIEGSDVAELTNRFASMPPHPEVPNALRRTRPWVPPVHSDGQHPGDLGAPVGEGQCLAEGYFARAGDAPIKGNRRDIVVHIALPLLSATGVPGPNTGEPLGHVQSAGNTGVGTSAIEESDRPSATEDDRASRSVGHEGWGGIGDLVQDDGIDFEPALLEGDLYIVAIIIDSAVLVDGSGRAIIPYHTRDNNVRDGTIDIGRVRCDPDLDRAGRSHGGCLGRNRSCAYSHSQDKSRSHRLNGNFGLPRSECDAECNGKLVVRPVTQVFIQVTAKMPVKFAVGVPIGGSHTGLRHPLPLLLARGRALALDRHYHGGTARSSTGA